VVRTFMSSRFGVQGFSQVDGSGVSRPNRIAPAALGTILKRMLAEPAHADFEAALPLAAHQGTLRNRMRGSAADGSCRAKTGTLHDVSALSGWCFNGGGRVMAFSILQNGVHSMSSAKGIEDRMAAAIARY
jgi:D-alanyl-D-alanine carboxypeptidase/D-alanyl-D-alanine-endopeptidase (penicillin-binding protein 4)